MIEQGRYLLAAALLHGALPVAAAIAPEPPAGRWLNARPEDDVEIEIDLAASEVRPSRAVEPRPGRDGAGTRTDDPRAAHPRDRARHPHNRPPEVLTAEPSDDLPPDDDNTFPSPDRRPEDDPLNRPPRAGEVGQRGHYGIPGPYAYHGLPDEGDSEPLPAPTKTPKRKYDEDSGTRAVEDEIRKDDAKLGLDFPGKGPIRAAFKGATYASAPRTCNASFSVTVSPSGKVTKITLLGFTGGDASNWNAVKSSVKAQLASMKLLMKSAFKKGATVGVMIRSFEKAPSGGDGPSLDGPGLSGWDVSDIGAKPTRHVKIGVNAQPIR